MTEDAICDDEDSDRAEMLSKTFRSPAAKAA